MEVTRALARYLVSSRYEDLPQRVRQEAARAVLNWFGCAIGAARHETVERALAAVRPFCGPPQASVPGRSERVDILHAALLNGISSHVLDFDDTHARAIHPSAPVLPALFAYAEWRNVTGAELVHAFVLGVEAEERIGLSVFPERYEILSNMYKPYSCGLVVHAAIDGCIDLARANRLRPADIEQIELIVSPLVPELTGKKSPQSGLEGKFSVYHAAAVGIIYGAAGEAQFSDEIVRDPQVIAVRDRVTAKADPSIRKTEARVTIRARDGRVLSRHVEHARGTLARPMSDAELEAKFRGLAAGVLPPAQIEEVIRLCWKLTALEDAGALARAAVPRTGT